MDFDGQLKAPFTMAIAGPTQSGKSTLVKNIIARRMEIMDPPIDRVIYCYTEYQPKLFNEIERFAPGVEFHKGLPTTFSGEGHKLVVLDDLMCEASKSDNMLKVFTRGSHHQLASIIYLTQNLFHKNQRDLTLSCKYLVLMKNPRDTCIVKHLGMQMNKGKKNAVLDEAYDDALKKKYGYVFIDYGQDQDDRCRIRNSVFPDDGTIIYTE